MSESRILVIDADGMRAERTLALLEFMDFNPRWVSEAQDIDVSRHRSNDWMAVVVGTLEDADRAAGFFTWLAGTSLPPPILLAEGDPLAFSRHYGLHEANVWPLEQPMRLAQVEALLRRASLRAPHCLAALRTQPAKQQKLSRHRMGHPHQGQPGGRQGQRGVRGVCHYLSDLFELEMSVRVELVETSRSASTGSA